jgi:putative peptide zinc metalloprotease protein
MAMNLDYLLSSVERTLSVRSRGDIQQVAIPLAGRPSYVLKDPLTSEHFQLTPHEHFLFTKLREQISLSELKREFETKFAPQTVSFTALQQGVNQLFEQGLLLSTAPGQGKQLLARRAKRQQRERLQNFLRALSFRIASWDASATIYKLHHGLRWLFSPLVGAIATVIVVYALWLLVIHNSEVMAKLPTIGELWQPRYLLMWLGTIILLKIAHELGHAVMCHHLGGRCHEMGVMLLAFFPALYCDVSDVWQMASKRQRMLVSAAGMIVEITLAAAAFIGWWYTEPGLLHIWLLGVAVIGSFGTLVINANPLLRYDGYYLLSDWLEVPNLAERGQGLLLSRVRKWLLAEPRSAESLLSNRQQRRVVAYAIASRLYSVIVLIAIYAMLFSLARPYHLENIVVLLAVLTLIGIALPYCHGIWQVLRNPANRSRLQTPRVAMLGGALAAIMLAIMFWPIRHTVAGKSVFVPENGRVIYATVGGELTHALKPGDQVNEGDVVAEFSDPQVSFALAKHTGEVAVKQAHFEQLNTLRALESRVSLQLPTAKAELTDAESQLEQYRRRADELVVRSPIAGMIIAPPNIEAEQTPDKLRNWAGSPLEARNQGCWVEPGTVLCMVGNLQKLSAIVTVDERDVADVQPGDEVRILLDSTPVRIITGRVKQVASRASEQDSNTNSELAERFHVIEVELADDQPRVAVGTGGLAKIAASHTTLARLVLNFFKRRLRMPW